MDISKTFVIYKLTCLSNNKIYIGWTSNFSQRMREHKSNAKLGTDSKLYRAIRKYGWDTFTKEIICCSKDELYISNTLEPMFIKKFNSFSRNEGYNQSSGGEGQTGFRHSTKTIEKFKKRIPWNKGLKTGPQPLAHKQKAGQARLGKLRGPYKNAKEYSKSALKYQQRK